MFKFFFFFWYKLTWILNKIHLERLVYGLMTIAFHTVSCKLIFDPYSCYINQQNTISLLFHSSSLFDENNTEIEIFILYSTFFFLLPAGSCCNNCFWNGDWQVKCPKNHPLWLATGDFLFSFLFFKVWSCCQCHIYWVSWSLGLPAMRYSQCRSIFIYNDPALTVAYFLNINYWTFLCWKLHVWCACQNY